MQLPDRKSIKDLFEGLLGRDVTIGDATEPLAPDVVPAPGFAVYVDDGGRLSAVALMDFALVAYTGAALALIPAGGAEAAIEDNEMPTNLMENTAEVLNVLAAPIGDFSGIHQRLERTYSPNDTLPPELAALAATVGAREDVTVSIAGYGSGRLAMVCAPGY
ncbi:hypothetical protein [Nocardioides sp. LHG3406-4]|uniref:hypothetical protein n=1 Tax=Nocardioides sp. LHG3406-4 TaxID=2804575 RepID=UPI003CE7FCAA